VINKIAKSGPENSSIKKPVILMVDYDAFFLASMSGVLRDQGFAVHTCNLWAEVSRCVSRYQPDLLLVDYNMPSIKGDEIIKAVRASSLLPDMKIALLSAEDKRSISRAVILSGADAWFLKRTPLMELSQEIRRLVSSRKIDKAVPTYPAATPRSKLIKSLVVDSSSFGRRALGKALEQKFNSQVIAACKGSEALAMFLEHKDIDLVILNVNLPVREVMDIFTELYNVNRKTRIPVIAISDENSDYDVMRALGMGACLYLIFPFTTDDVVNAIENVMSPVKQDNPELSISRSEPGGMGLMPELM
jgi:DNA-binding response OmpR family regulator